MEIETKIIQELERLESTVDGLGLGLDEGIKRAVAILNLAGIKTSASCEGHLDRGLAFPWIDIEAPEPEGWEDDDSKQTDWYLANMKQHIATLKLLRSFYKSRVTPIKYRLELAPVGTYGAVRLAPIGGEWTEDTDRDKELALKAKIDELEAFALFVKRGLYLD